MSLRRLEAVNLRNIERAVLEELGPRVVIFGGNGAGKTTLLEAVYLLSRGRSFRARQWTEVVRRGKGHARIAGVLDQGGRRNAVSVDWDGRSTRLSWNGLEGEGFGAMARRMPVAILAPAGIRAVEAGPDERRRWLDWGVFHVEPDFGGIWAEYRHVLRQRNAALAAHATDGELDAWDRSVATLGDRVAAARRDYFEGLAAAFRDWASRLLDIGRLEITLHPGWPRESELRACLKTARKGDRARGHTRAGPHRADWGLVLEGRQASGLSRGQAKMVALSYWLAQASLVATAERPAILLVDDFGAELDRRHREAGILALGELAAAKRIQPVVTISEREDAEAWSGDGAVWFHVEHGRVARML